MSNLYPLEEKKSSVLAGEIGRQLMASLDFFAVEANIILDLGGAAGFTYGYLQQRFPAAQITAPEDFLDVSNLPLKDHSVDLIVANLVLPQAQDFAICIREWRRLLKKGGLVLFTGFGPDTQFKENIHCVDMHILGDQLLAEKMQGPVLDVEHITVEYKTVLQAQQELYAEGYINENTLVALHCDFEVIYGHAWGAGPQITHSPDVSGVVKIPLSQLKRPSYRSSEKSFGKSTKKLF
jgi:SAM-dependent methyltransferase